MSLIDRLKDPERAPPAVRNKKTGLVAAAVAIVVAVVVISIVVASWAAYQQSQARPNPFFPILLPQPQCRGTLAVSLYNGNLFIGVSYRLWIYPINVTSGSATAEPLISSGNLRAQERLVIPNDVPCGWTRTALAWQGGAWHYQDVIVEGQVVEVSFSY